MRCRNVFNGDTRVVGSGMWHVRDLVAVGNSNDALPCYGLGGLWWKCVGEGTWCQNEEWREVLGCGGGKWVLEVEHHRVMNK